MLIIPGAVWDIPQPPSQEAEEVATAGEQTPLDGGEAENANNAEN